MNDSMILSPYGFYATQSMLDALDTLKNCAAGRFATIKGYVPLSAKSWVKLPKYDATITTRFDTEKLYNRRKAALEAMKLEDCMVYVMQDNVLCKLDASALRHAFDARMKDEIASMNRERPDTANHREGQARCHVNICNGVRVHLKTYKSNDGIMLPYVTDDSNTVAESIRVHGIQQHRRYIEKGERKIVNSGVPVRVSNIIKKALNFRSVALTSYTLGDNFDSLAIDGNLLTPDDITPDMVEATED